MITSVSLCKCLNRCARKNNSLRFVIFPGTFTALRRNPRNGERMRYAANARRARLPSGNVKGPKKSNAIGADYILNTTIAPPITMRSRFCRRHENVFWDDCQEFVRKVNDAARRQLGGDSQHPMEAEWEYACRFGNQPGFRFWGLGFRLCCSALP